MKASKKYQLIVFLIVFCIALIGGIFHFQHKLTYLERTNFNSTPDAYVEVNNSSSVIEQEFTMPYAMISRVGIQIGTFNRVNNSQWLASVIDPSDGSTVCSKMFDGSRITNDQFNDVIFNNKNYSVRKGEQYILRIQSVNAVWNTGLAFWRSNEAVDHNHLYVDGQEQSGSLCLKFYGGDIDGWWTGFFILVMAWIAVCALIYFRNGADGLRTVQGSVALQSLLIALLSFLLIASFAVNPGWTDEFDNLRAGMEISKGAVLYRDYVTQHTPVPSYLCGIFALFGAGSVEQMRLSYYLLISAIWGFLYYRHARSFGWKKMVLLPVLEVIFVTTMINPQGWMIMSDGVQGLCMVALILEFIRYLDDKKLSIGRCIIISVCIWGSFGSAFVSAYALIFAALLFVIREIQLIHEGVIVRKGFLKRYSALFFAIIIPFICAVAYFKINHALGDAYNLTYKFNRDIYSVYNSGFGTKPFQPLVNAFQNFFSLIADNIGAVVRAQATNVQIVQLIFAVTATIIIIKLFMKKDYYEALLLFFLMCGNATRGYGFHGLASWYVVVAIVTIHYDLLLPLPQKIRIPVMGIFTIFMLSMYISTLGNNLLTDISPVSDIETAAIEATNDGDRILVDSYTYDSLYFCYKNRFPANRCAYFLPWYMDEYEQWTIEDLEHWKPKVVIYNQDNVVWDVYQYFTPAFLSQLQQEYTRSSDDSSNWQYYYWVRK